MERLTILVGRLYKSVTQTTSRTFYAPRQRDWSARGTSTKVMFQYVSRSSAQLIREKKSWKMYNEVIKLFIQHNWFQRKKDININLMLM